MSYQQITRFQITVDLIANISGTDQAIDNRKTLLWSTIFCTIDENNLVNFGPPAKNDLDIWPTTLKFSTVLEVVEVHVRTEFHLAEYSDSWVIVSTSFLPYLAMVKNPIIRSCDLDLWGMNLKFNRVHALVNIHVHAKFHQAKCSGSWVILHTEKKLRLTQYSPSLPHGHWQVIHQLLASIKKA